MARLVSCGSRAKGLNVIGNLLVVERKSGVRLTIHLQGKLDMPALDLFFEKLANRCCQRFAALRKAELKVKEAMVHALKGECEGGVFAGVDPAGGVASHGEMGGESIGGFSAVRQLP